jgi:superfamily I DNA/RNA helicase
MGLIRRYAPRSEWSPIGVKELESNALDVVRSTDNRSVIAGPGSGKTELLAQRASYLLQCNVSRAPRHILAISYKRDAAFNLGARVRSRCHPTQAHRFDSLTFDAFAKSLVDRFGQALPARWRPTPDYEIAHLQALAVADFLRSLDPPGSVGRRADIMALPEKTFERDCLIHFPIPEEELENPTPAQWAARQFWESWLHGTGKSYLSFAMIGRLAELLVRTNPMVKQVLQLTYSHLFMDEFQDTTQVQYDLVKTIFMRSTTVVTAVGDYKQQIMRWAMAMEDPFAPFEADFHAKRTTLLNNYRSSPDLVKIQAILARALDARAAPAISKATGTVTGDSCEVWGFTTAAAEAQHLANFVACEMKEYDLVPRDFSVLVRVKAGDFTKHLEPAFAAKKLALRNEAAVVGGVALQELLAEEVSDILLMLLRMLTMERAGHYWPDCVEMMCGIRGLPIEDDAGRIKIAASLSELASAFQGKFPKPVGDRSGVEAAVKFVLDFVGRRSLLVSSPAYRQGDWLDKVIAAATEHLEISCKAAADWHTALDTYEGVHAIPLMTIHKSKGLEYHTVIFVGLEDEAWFNFKKQTQEETSGFFVAFTRAKQRVIFTYCEERGSRAAVAPLYRLLTDAGVKTIARA